MDRKAPSGVAKPGKERTARDRKLDREVRWRLFREEEMPARFRRLERLERVARASGP